MPTPFDIVDICVQLVRNNITVHTITSSTTTAVRDAVTKQISSDKWRLTADSALVVDWDLDQSVRDVVRYRWHEDEWRDEPGDTFAYHAKKTPIPTGRDFREEDRGGILLIMESPHLHEVTCDLQPVSPASGLTGYNIHVLKSKLAPLIERMPQQWRRNGLSLTLCNPLQFPASLRLDPIDSSLRNDLFRKGINKLHDDFRARLDNYAPVLIINTCTGKPVAAENPRKPDPKWVARKLISAWLTEKEIPFHRIAYGHPSKNETGGSLMRKGRPYTNARPRCHVVELPHPSTWRSTWNWSLELGG
ncbi:hypothetical protein [Pyxidicoccus caerfyrddinensis]|uniref:hypothetical protein n=1 Tax=Pyxidicoccus caerfyrddinensis TaxID=2709663 RepID=UPI0013DBECD2|nr:hypothetical protein [Pyxidicoccus caerfyrddinensis]